METPNKSKQGLAVIVFHQGHKCEPVQDVPTEAWRVPARDFQVYFCSSELAVEGGKDCVMTIKL